MLVTLLAEQGEVYLVSINVKLIQTEIVVILNLLLVETLMRFLDRIKLRIVIFCTFMNSDCLSAYVSRAVTC
jgi:hypothetical protein